MEHDTSFQMYVTHMHSTLTALIFVRNPFYHPLLLPYHTGENIVFKVVKVDPDILVIRWPYFGPIQFNDFSG